MAKVRDRYWAGVRDAGRVTESSDEPISQPLSKEHPLDRALRALGPRIPVDERLEVVWQTYEAATRQRLNRPPSEAQRADVLRWTRRPAEGGEAILFNRQLQATPVLYGTVAEKASISAQLGCRIHHAGDVQTGPVITFPVGIEPWSAQSDPEKVAVREAVTAAVCAKGSQLLPFDDLPLCMTITALVARASPRKDVDNLVKGLLDAMQGYLYANDSQIQCLTVRRMEYAGAHGHYIVHVTPAVPVTSDVIFDTPTPPILASGQVPWPRS